MMLILWFIYIANEDDYIATESLFIFMLCISNVKDSFVNFDCLMKPHNFKIHSSVSCFL